MELTMDKIEVSLKKIFSESDEHVRKLIDDLLKYTRENDSEDLKRFVTGLGILKKFGYLDVAYEDREIPYDKSSCWYDTTTSTITMSKDKNSLDGSLSLSDFIHETTHAMHAIMLNYEIPPEFNEIKKEFKKNECINIFLASYVFSSSRELKDIANDEILDFGDDVKKRINSIIKVYDAFNDIFDALLDGRLLDGVNITSLAYNEFLKLDPNEEDYEKKKAAIMNEYNRIYNQKGLYDLNFNEMYYYRDVIMTPGHGSDYYSNENNAFKEIIANYMSIKLCSKNSSAQCNEMVNGILTTIFGDSLERFSDKIIDSIFTTFDMGIDGMLVGFSSDDKNFFRSADIQNPLVIAFASEEIRNDKEFMLEYLKKIPKDSIARAFVTKLVGKELCSDEDFLKQLADDNYEIMRLANRGVLSKEEYTDLANYTTSKNAYNIYTLDIDRLENGLEGFKDIALKFIDSNPNNFGALNPMDLMLRDGGQDLYKFLAVTASGKHCNLGFISPDKLDIERYDPFYYQIVLERIKDNPFEIEYCNYNYLAKEPAMNVTKVALSNCLEKIEDVQELPQDKLKIIGMLYGKLGVLNITDKNSLNDEQLSIIRDKLAEDIRIHKENMKSVEVGKTI